METVMALKITRRAFIATGAATIALSYHDSGWTQTWPSRPIKIVCAYPAGGLADTLARVYGEYLSQKLGQPVIVENKAGASGSIAAAAVKQSPPDGYTLLLAITATLVQSRVLFKTLPYDADRDFALISSMSAGYLPLVAYKATNATNLKEFVEYARRNVTNVGTFGAGSYPHIVVAELNKQYGLQMKAVHYRGEAPACSRRRWGVTPMPSTRWNPELGGQSPCRRGRGAESFPTFPHSSSRVPSPSSLL